MGLKVEDKLSHVSRKRAELDGEEAMYELRRAATSASEAADKTKEDFQIAQKARKLLLVVLVFACSMAAWGYAWPKHYTRPHS